MSDPKPFVCPLCPLHCDDVTLAESGQLLAATECKIVDEFTIAKPRNLDSQQTTDKPSRPLSVITRGTDLATSRELANLQRAGKIHLVIESDPSLDALSEVVSRDGIVSATLGEVNARADLILVLGEVQASWPRLMEKVQAKRKAHIECKQITAKVLTSFANHIRALSESKESFSPDRLQPPTTNLNTDQETAARHWLTAQYTAMIVGPNAFPEGEESMAAAMLARLVRSRNETSRAVCVSLDEAATLRSVCLWKSNELPLSLRTDLARLKTFDIRIGSPLSLSSPLANVQLGGADPGEDIASSYEPVAIPGLHLRSMVVRGDGSVSLPLSAPIKNGASLPHIVEWFQQPR